MSVVTHRIHLQNRLFGLTRCCIAVGMALAVSACSSSVSRFDYPAFGNQRGDNITTASLNPVPAEAVYPDGAPANSTAVTRQDLPPPSTPYAQPQQNQYAAAQPTQPTQTQPAPLPPRAAPYQAPPPAPQPVARSQPAPKPVPANRTHTVSRGDTLYKISKQYGVDINDIKQASSLRSDRLSLGQKLTIPGAGAPKPVTTVKTYTVKRGDSISRIARDHNVETDEILQANNLNRRSVLSLGQKLTIPGQPAAASNAPVRVASSNASVPLPATNPARKRPTAAPLPQNKSVAGDRPQQKVASRTSNLPKPEPMAGNQFRWPVKGRIISSYGAKPSGKHNDGINVAVPKGTSIKAAENGVVAYAGSELEPYGQLILVRHANNWVTAYAHNSDLLVKRGDTVRRGQIIAKAGQTGNVSQPQLHFELRKGSKPVNPLSYMASN